MTSIVCRDFHLPRGPSFRIVLSEQACSMRQHNESRHISSMDNRSRFHRKKISLCAPDFVAADEATAELTLDARNVAEKTQCDANYCAALYVFAEMSLFSPGV